MNPGNYTCAVEKRCTRTAETTMTVDHVVVWACRRCAEQQREG